MFTMFLWHYIPVSHSLWWQKRHIDEQIDLLISVLGLIQDKRYQVHEVLKIVSVISAMSLHESLGQGMDLIDGVKRVVFILELSDLKRIIYFWFKMESVDQDRMGVFAIVYEKWSFPDVWTKSFPGASMWWLWYILADKNNMTIVIIGAGYGEFVSGYASIFLTIRSQFLLWLYLRKECFILWEVIYYEK